MKKRAVFNPMVTVSTRFTNMPQSAQVLYFQLGTHADGDGFVFEPDDVIRRIGSSREDLKILIQEKYVITSNVSTGVYVVMDIMIEED